MTRSAVITSSCGNGQNRLSTPPNPSLTESKRAMYTTKNEVKFPFRLWEMLDEAEKEGWEHIICWLPEGDGFRILDPNTFATDVMPRYFTMRHFKSFQRQLSLYSFKRETEGRKRDAYCHPFFCRANRELCVFVPREKKRPPKNKGSRSNRTQNGAVQSKEIRLGMSSPAVSRFSQNFETSESSHVGVHQGETSNLGTLAPSSQEQKFSFFPKVEQTLNQENRILTIEQPLNQKLVQSQWQQQQSHLSPGRSLQFPTDHKTSNITWIQDHDANLWNFVNGLVVDSSEFLNNKNGLAKDVLSFTTDEILSEIAATFNTNCTENGQSSSLGENTTSINDKGNITPLLAFPLQEDP